MKEKLHVDNCAMHTEFAQHLSLSLYLHLTLKNSLCTALGIIKEEKPSWITFLDYFFFTYDLCCYVNKNSNSANNNRILFEENRQYFSCIMLSRLDATKCDTLRKWPISNSHCMLSDSAVCVPFVDVVVVGVSSVSRC